MRDAGDEHGASVSDLLSNSHQTPEWHTAVPTTANDITALRQDLHLWAENAGMSVEQVEMAALATYEAMANAAIHAYSDASGTVELDAVRHQSPPEIETTVRDHGH